jgi:asparagine synthase (glutamine-hydrolysing)
MCGITGAVWSTHGTPVDEALLARMTDVLAHRGPDDRGSYRSELLVDQGYGAIPGVALGFRRLAIIDLATGHQPMTNEDGTIHLVFNGEIYNYRDLRRRLEGSGHQFKTASDTETLIHLYEDEGVDFLKHTNGMFALALWDSRHRQLVLARDRLGEKPLVYRIEPDRLLFASEIKSLLEVPGVPREIDPNSLDEYLCYQYVPHPRTIFRGIYKLPPGHFAVYREGRLAVRPYWEPDFTQELRRTAGDYREELRSLLTSSVRLRLESEVPLGAFLSGGIDSSIVVGLMSQCGANPVRTFSIGFPVKSFDETHFAREVARKFNTRHEEFIVEPKGLEVLPRLVWHYDEPFGDSSAIPTWYVSELTRRHVTVALTGDGGDELFAGYDRYRAVRLGAWFDRLPAPLRGLLAGPYWRWIPAPPKQKSAIRRIKRLAEALSLDPAQRNLEWVSIFNLARRASLYSDDFVSRLGNSDPGNFLRVAHLRSRGRDPITAASLADVLTYLPCDLLTKVDVASMAHSLETRPPFLDHRVVELAARMPASLKMSLWKGKRILIDAFRDLLPPKVARRSKMGFGVPLDHWFRHELADFTRDVLLSETALSRGMFRPEVVRRLVDDHQSGTFDHSFRLWSLVFLELWTRRWIDGAPAAETTSRCQTSAGT